MTDNIFKDDLLRDEALAIIRSFLVPYTENVKK